MSYRSAHLWTQSTRAELPYFADQRKILGISNFLNLIINLLFAIVGFLDYWQQRR